MKPRSQEIRLRTSPGRLRQKPTGPFGGHYAPSPTALFLPYAVIVLVGFPLLLAGCTGTRSIPVGPTAPPLPIVPTAPWTPERDDDAGAVVMVCRDRSSGPRCIPYGARAAADAWSTCRAMGYAGAGMRPYATTQSTPFEPGARYSVTFDCVDSGDD